MELISPCSGCSNSNSSCFGEASNNLPAHLLYLFQQVCAVSNEKLQLPIVTCELGYLYNKDAVLTALLERTLNSTFAHLRGLKDLIELKVTLLLYYHTSANSAPLHCRICPMHSQMRYSNMLYHTAVHTKQSLRRDSNWQQRSSTVCVSCNTARVWWTVSICSSAMHWLGTC
jgi:Rtf2 RING-finger